MHILVIVSEFPKVTETFAISNILHYLSRGHAVDLFHIKPFREKEVLHPEAAPVVERAFTYSWFGKRSAAALLSALATRPFRLLDVVVRMTWAFRSEPARLAASFALLPKALAMAQKARRDGVEHIHAEFAGHPATAAWIAHQLYGIPFSFSAHMHDIFVSQSLLAEKSQAARFVRTISRFNMDMLSKLRGFAAEKLRLVRCGVDLDRFSAEQRPFPSGGEYFEIVFVGSLQRRKGCDLLLAALKSLQSPVKWHLTVIGEGPESARLQQLASEFPPGTVSMLGAQPSSAVLENFSLANLVVVPSVPADGGRSEGIPVVLMEALSLARPVIASRLSGIPELVEDGVTGLLIEPGDVQQLASAIGRVMDDYDEALRRGRSGKERVVTEYNIKENAEQLLRLIEAERA